MDTSDPQIGFDAAGVCNHCREHERQIAALPPSDPAALARLAGRMRADGAGKEYDCVLGVSGGVDSSWTLVRAVELGLRPLAVHFDNGWNSELAVQNIEQLVKRLDVDLFTFVVDWNEFRDLQLAFLKASTPDAEIPTDHAITALLRQTATARGVRYVVLGTNARTESHLPPAWSQGHTDWIYIRGVHRRFGTRRLRTYPHYSPLRDLWYRVRLENVELLNYLDFVKAEAKAKLIADYGWRDYGGKHCESLYTRFYQEYLLPLKFGYDKRRTHLSSLICAGEITRPQALAALAVPPGDPQRAAEDRAYVIKKLGLTEEQFGEILARPKRTRADYPHGADITRTVAYRAARRIWRAWRDRGGARP
jgi:N-acetyl sugar amidotransferase